MMHELRELSTGQYQVLSYEIRMNAFNKIERVELHKFITSNDIELSQDAAISQLISMGVEPGDIDIAFEYFENYGHNVANFGIMGGLTHTNFEGVTQ